MFAKVFEQIFDSSIADDYQTRHVFMDLLVLADSEGALDMTQGAIARRTNVPLEIVTQAITALCAPDPESRTKEHEGRRLLPLDPERPWGWRIVNYELYRSIRDEESRREYFRVYRQKEREEKRKKAEKAELRKRQAEERKKLWANIGGYVTEADVTATANKELAALANQEAAQ